MDKAKDEAFKTLHALLIKKLSAQDIKHNLFSKGQLTSAEMDRIGKQTSGRGGYEEDGIVSPYCRSSNDQA